MTGTRLFAVAMTVAVATPDPQTMPLLPPPANMSRSGSNAEQPRHQIVTIAVRTPKRRVNRVRRRVSMTRER